METLDNTHTELRKLWGSLRDDSDPLVVQMRDRFR